MHGARDAKRGIDKSGENDAGQGSAVETSVIESFSLTSDRPPLCPSLGRRQIMPLLGCHSNLSKHKISECSGTRSLTMETTRLKVMADSYHNIGLAAAPIEMTTSGSGFGMRSST
jgi:hypothetical protein